MKSASERQNKTYNMSEIDAISEALETRENAPVEDTVDTAQPEEQEKSASWNAQVDKEKNIMEGLGWIKSICIGILVGVLLVVFVIQRNDVSGSSMEPTLMSGDKIFAEKISTYMDTYKRGDIVILDGSNMEGYSHEEYLIKRIVGMPGDTIRIAEGKVFIKTATSDTFYELDESYLPSSTVTTVSGTGYSKGYDEMKLASNEYYCLGDNRLVSNDSRTLGPFSEDRIKGVAVFRVYPFGSIGII